MPRQDMRAINALRAELRTMERGRNYFFSGANEHWCAGKTRVRSIRHNLKAARPADWQCWSLRAGDGHGDVHATWRGPRRMPRFGNTRGPRLNSLFGVNAAPIGPKMSQADKSVGIVDTNCHDPMDGLI
jgi:hypothetical protein